MNSFKQSFFKDGKLNISLIALKVGFLLMGLIYLLLFIKFKNISIGSFIYPPHPFTFFHWIMLLPAIACVAFAILATNEKWLSVAWQIAVIMIAFLVITAIVGIFTGMKSVTSNSADYLKLDSYFEENDAPMLDPKSDVEKTMTFSEAISKLMPESIPENAKGVNYHYDYSSLPVLGGHFDVFAKWQLDESALSNEVARLQKLYPSAKQYSGEKNGSTQYFLIRNNDDDGEYYYVFYGVDVNKKSITYGVSYSERSSSVPYFEKQGIDLGRIGKVEREEVGAGETAGPVEQSEETEE